MFELYVCTYSTYHVHSVISLIRQNISYKFYTCFSFRHFRIQNQRKPILFCKKLSENVATESVGVTVVFFSQQKPLNYRNFLKMYKMKSVKKCFISRIYVFHINIMRIIIIMKSLENFTYFFY